MIRRLICRLRGHRWERWTYTAPDPDGGVQWRTAVCGFCGFDWVRES